MRAASYENLPFYHYFLLCLLFFHSNHSNHSHDLLQRDGISLEERGLLSRSIEYYNVDRCFKQGGGGWMFRVVVITLIAEHSHRLAYKEDGKSSVDIGRSLHHPYLSISPYFPLLLFLVAILFLPFTIYYDLAPSWNLSCNNHSLYE